MTRSNTIGFLRTPGGIKIIGGKFSVHLTFDEIYRLNTFISTGSRASSRRLEENFERSALRSAPLAELEIEIDRRAGIRDARLEREEREAAREDDE
ncbi:MAG: hypothetical protein U5M23_02940 [Marinagarivorans sp.]|nr:hypothetical protein [Marinagarivorans sp.]